MKFKMEDKNLPIDSMSVEELAEFSQGLEARVLTEETIKKIEKAFDIDPKNTRTIEVCCNEAHIHNYSCLKFTNSYSAIVLRLLNEIRGYKKRLDEIRRITDYTK